MDLSHLAWPFFDVDHRQFAAEFERWATARLGEFEQCEGGDGSDARQIFKLLAAAGWLDKTLPQGTGRLDLRSVSLLREICGHSSAMADVALSEPWLEILPVALYGSLELKQQFLPGYLSGQLIPAFALSEPDAGSDVAAITTTARLDGDHYVLNGRKTWTSNAGLADLYIVFARIDERRGLCRHCGVCRRRGRERDRPGGTFIGLAAAHGRHLDSQQLPRPQNSPDRRTGAGLQNSNELPRSCSGRRSARPRSGSRGGRSPKRSNAACHGPRSRNRLRNISSSRPSSPIWQ